MALSSKKKDFTLAEVREGRKGEGEGARRMQPLNEQDYLLVSSLNTFWNSTSAWVYEEVECCNVNRFVKELDNCTASHRQQDTH